MHSMLFTECCEDVMHKRNIALMLGVLLAGGFVDEVLAQTGNLLPNRGVDLTMLPR